MSKTATPPRQITFRAPGRQPVTGVVRNPQATLGVASRAVAEKFGFAGGYEAVVDGQVVPLDTPLADLPADLMLVPDLTPARGAG